MEKQDLIKKLEEINRERNIIIQSLRRYGTPHKESPTFNIRDEFNKYRCKYLDKYGILKNSNGIYVFHVKEVILVHSQVTFNCDHMYISVNSSAPCANYFKTKDVYQPLIRSKEFNENSGSFGFGILEDIQWIDECTYNNLTEQDLLLEELKSDLNIIRNKFLDRQSKIAILKIEQVEKELNKER